jgi:hypothetical protein
LSSHPEDLGGHSCVSGTLSLTETSVSSYLENVSITVLEYLPFLLAS